MNKMQGPSCLANSFHTFFYITPDSDLFAIQSLAKIGTPLCSMSYGVKGVSYLFSVPGNVIRCRSRCSHTVDEGKYSVVLSHYYNLVWGAGMPEGTATGRETFLVPLISITAHRSNMVGLHKTP